MLISWRRCAAVLLQPMSAALFPQPSIDGLQGMVVSVETPAIATQCAVGEHDLMLIA